MKVLIAEDTHVTQVMLRNTLRTLGYDVLVASDGAEAWAQWSADPVRLIISDWLMPEMNGLELCRRVRDAQAESTEYTYFILLTVKDDRASLIEGMAAGADDFMTKPLDPDELRVRLAAASRVLALRDRLVRLEGLLPICSYCHNIRDEHEVWRGLEAYIEEHSRAHFTHSICPDCMRTQLEQTPAPAD